jgi:hypothetical protein
MSQLTNAPAAEIVNALKNINDLIAQQTGTAPLYIETSSNGLFVHELNNNGRYVLLYIDQAELAELVLKYHAQLTKIMFKAN